MNGYCKVVILGTMTRDPETRFTPSNSSVTSFSLAVNRSWKTSTGEKKEAVSFIDCESWGKRGEAIKQYFSKGSTILVDGSIIQEMWKDKNDGSNRSKLKVAVESFQFTGERRERQEAEPAQVSQSRGGWGSSRNESGGSDSFAPIGDGDIPF